MPSQILGNNPRGLLFIVSAPAGTGKTTLVTKLIEEFPCVVASISCTTRSPRPGEKDGIDYFFLNAEEFKEKIESGDFLEFVNLYGDYYGTPRRYVEDRLNQGKHVVLVIDTQGGLKLREQLKAVFIFLKPPSLEVLRERLTNRQTESPSIIQERLNWAEKEMRENQKYDYEIVNDDLETAYQVLKSIIIAEEHRVIKGDGNPL